MQLPEKKKVKCLQEGASRIRKKPCSRDKGCFPAPNWAPTSLLNSPWEEQNTAEVKISSETWSPTVEALSATTNLGSIRTMQKARWEKQTYPTDPTKLLLMGTYEIFLCRQIPTFLKNTGFYIWNFDCYQVHPLFTMGRQEL